MPAASTVRRAMYGVRCTATYREHRGVLVEDTWTANAVGKSKSPAACNNHASDALPPRATHFGCRATVCSTVCCIPVLRCAGSVSTSAHHTAWPRDDCVRATRCPHSHQRRHNFKPSSFGRSLRRRLACAWRNVAFAWIAETSPNDVSQLGRRCRKYLNECASYGNLSSTSRRRVKAKLG